LFRGFPQFFPKNDRILPQKDNNRFLTDPVQFIIQKYVSSLSQDSVFLLISECLRLPDSRPRAAATLVTQVAYSPAVSHLLFQSI
jgi:hypothetical protein